MSFTNGKSWRDVTSLLGTSSWLGSSSWLGGSSWNGGLTRVSAVTNRLLAPPQQLDATKTFFSAETWHRQFEAVNGVIEIWWANFYTATGGGAPGGGCSDRSPGSIATATAQLVYTDATSGNPVTVNLIDKVGGTTALTAPNGGWFKAYAIISSAANSVIKPRIAGNMPSGIMYSLSKADIANGDLFQFGTSAIPLGTTPVNTFGSFRTWYGPCLIAAQSSKPVLAIIGDSRDDGLRDMANDATGNMGVFMRAFGGTVACVNLSGRGDLAQSFNDAASSVRRRELLAFATFAGLGNGINDLGANRTAAQLIADQQSIAALVAKPAVWRTQNPFTIGGITTPWSATPEAQRQLYNTFVRTQPVYFDPDGVLSTGASGGWTNEDSVAQDYLHETYVGNTYAAINGALVGTTVGTHGIAARAAGAAMPGSGTNLFASSRDMSTGSWAKNGITLTTGQLDAECNSTAQLLLETTANANHCPAQGPITVTPGTYEVWMDLAPSGRDWFTYEIDDSAFSAPGFQAYNVTTGALGSAFTSSATVVNMLSATITPISNGFYRCKATFTTGVAVTGIYVSAKFTVGNLTTQSYVGDVTKGMVSRPDMWLRKIA